MGAIDVDAGNCEDKNVIIEPSIKRQKLSGGSLSLTASTCTSTSLSSSGAEKEEEESENSNNESNNVDSGGNSIIDLIDIDEHVNSNNGTQKNKNVEDVVANSIVDLTAIDEDTGIDQKVYATLKNDKLSTSPTNTNTTPSLPHSHPPPSRRSKRERKSTLIYIDGNPVLRQNNYVLKGHEYSHQAFQSQSHSLHHRLKTEREQIRRAKRESLHSTTHTTPRTPSLIERARITHNQRVRARTAAKEPRRTKWLHDHVDILSPFLHPKTEARIRETPPDASSYTPREAFVQPEGIIGELRDYQLDGVHFLARMDGRNLGMILGDEMGLGKTLQTIALLCHLKETKDVVNGMCDGGREVGVTGPSLVVCPLSVLYSWCTELERWAPQLKFLRLHSSSTEDRDAQKAKFLKDAVHFDVVVTTYEMVKNPSLSSIWTRQYFNYLVLDEGHRIKNNECILTQCVRKIHCGNRLILTGTPLQNNLVELWSLLYFLHPDVFTDSQPFAEVFDISSKDHTIDKVKLRAAHDILGLFMIRRMKDEVEKLMPKKIETKVLCPLSTTQIYWYKALLLKDINILTNLDSTQKSSDGKVIKVLNKVPESKTKQLTSLFMQLRKCCIHPFLFRGAEGDIESTTLTNLISSSGKLAVLDALLRSLYRKKHRVVLFSQFTSVLDILDDYARERGWVYSRFDGGMLRAKRNYNVNRFNAEGSDVFLFLMSTRAGGMGLNLQTADTCILFDSDWNPQPDIQAMARVHRIGQKKTVHVYRLVSGGTIEERMIERAQKKLFLDKMVNSGAVDDDDSNDQKGGGLSASELISSIKFGCNAVFGDPSLNDLPKDEDIEMITDRERTEDYSAGKLKGGVSQSTNDFDTEVKAKPSTQFGGMDFTAVREAYKNDSRVGLKGGMKAIADYWSTEVKKNEKRKRKERLVMVYSKGSGLGLSTAVLKSNNYDFSTGETSVFDRELSGRGGDYKDVKKKVLKSGRDFGQQDFCQVCKSKNKDSLVCCPRCPVAMHLDCVGVQSKQELMCCSHHRCTSCEKNHSNAGGMLFPCQSCHKSFCEDCLPGPEEGMRLLGRCERFEKLDFDSMSKFAYIHCSRECEDLARRMFDWKPAQLGDRQGLPDVIDVSSHFGKQISETTVKLPNLERM